MNTGEGYRKLADWFFGIFAEFAVVTAASEANVISSSLDHFHMVRELNKKTGLRS